MLEKPEISAELARMQTLPTWHSLAIAERYKFVVNIIAVVVVIVFVVNTFTFSAMNCFWRRASHLIRSAFLKKVNNGQLSRLSLSRPVSLSLSIVIRDMHLEFAYY